MMAEMFEERGGSTMTDRDRILLTQFTGCGG